MPRGKGSRRSGSIRARDGKWQVRLYVGRVDGKQIVRTKTAPSLAVAKRVLVGMQAELAKERASGKAEGGGLTVGEALEAWMAEGAGRWSPRTVDVHRHVAEHYLGELRDREADRLSVQELEAFYGRLVGSGLAPGTVLRAHVALRAALGVAQRRELCERNVAALARAPRPGPARRILPEAEAIGELVRELEEREPQMALCLRLLAVSGARRGEVVAARWVDVSIPRGTWTIARSAVLGKDRGGHEAVVVRESPKTSRSRRTIALDEATVRRLEEARGRAEAIAAAFGTCLVRDAYVLSDEPRGEAPWRPDRVSKRWRALRSEAGLDGVRLHDLRHWVVTSLLQAGHSVPDVAERVGDNPKTVLAVYAAAVATNSSRQSEELSAMLGW